MSHGGKRKGAGRPSAGKTQWLQLRLAPVQHAWLALKAEDDDTTMTAVVLGMLGKAGMPMPEPPKAKKQPRKSARAKASDQI